MPFKFPLSAEVRIATSDEAGEIIGRAEYTTSEPSYLLRYKSTDGRAVESWWGESALASAL
jgi:hypothetical protein